MISDPATDAAFDRLTRTSWSAIDLLAYEFPEPRWAVPGLLAEGANLLAGAPKVGKSWFAYGIAVAVASGGRAVGKIKVDPGPVLYLALEDTPRRLQSRLRMILNGAAPPDGLELELRCERFPDGLERVRRFHAEHSQMRLAVIDVLARVRPVKGDRDSAYDADYDAMRHVKDLADELGICILVVHHTRKAASEDFLDDVSGTQGIAGGADAVLVLKRGRGKADATLKVTGRDIEEAEHALSFDPTCGLWSMLEGEADDYRLSDTRRTVLTYLRERGASTPKVIHEKTGIAYETVKKTTQRMLNDGQLDSAEGAYWDPETGPDPMSPVPPIPDVPDLRVVGDGGDTGDTLHGGAA